jgi:uncharacterized protein (TIGR02646 family)
MIKIEKLQQPPEVLIGFGAEWTKALSNAIQQHGGYENIPKKQKEQLIKFYRHDDIKAALFPISHYKCAFCECIPEEGGGNIEVEHFLPKSLYPLLTFEWSNLLPVCRKCNGYKLDWDTGSKPILNPSVDNPEEYLAFKDIKLCPAEDSPDKELSRTTIDVLQLNRISGLLAPRAKLLLVLYEYEVRVEQFLNEFDACKSARVRYNLVTKLRESLQGILNLAKPESNHSFFCKFFIFKSEIIKKALTIVAENE